MVSRQLSNERLSKYSAMTTVTAFSLAALAAPGYGGACNRHHQLLGHRSLQPNLKQKLSGLSKFSWYAKYVSQRVENDHS